MKEEVELIEVYLYLNKEVWGGLFFSCILHYIPFYYCIIGQSLQSNQDKQAMSYKFSTLREVRARGLWVLNYVFFKCWIDIMMACPRLNQSWNGVLEVELVMGWVKSESNTGMNFQKWNKHDERWIEFLQFL